MCATALEMQAKRALSLVDPCTENVDSATRLFTVLAPLHELHGRDAELLARAAAGHRFIRAWHPFGDTSRALMRSALADLPSADASVVEASATCAADVAAEYGQDAWSRLLHADRLRVMWFAAILRLAECIDSMCSTSRGAIHAAWTDETLHLEIGGVVLADHEVQRMLGCSTTLEATTGRRVLLTSSPRRRGAA
jgi:hypothetical protein